MYVGLCTKVNRVGAKPRHYRKRRVTSFSGSANTEPGAVATGLWANFDASNVAKQAQLIVRPGRYRSWFCICRPMTEHSYRSLV